MFLLNPAGPTRLINVCAAFPASSALQETPERPTVTYPPALLWDESQTLTLQNKKHTQWELLLWSWLAWVLLRLSPRSEENKPRKPVKPRGGVPFPPGWECEQTQRRRYSDPRGKHRQSGEWHPYLFITRESDASDGSQGPFITLQPEQTAVQIRHNNPPMLFMILSESHTHTHTHTSALGVEANSALRKHSQQASTCNLAVGPRLSLRALSGFCNERKIWVWFMCSHNTHTHTQI